MSHKLMTLSAFCKKILFNCYTLNLHGLDIQSGNQKNSLQFIAFGAVCFDDSRDKFQEFAASNMCWQYELPVICVAVWAASNMWQKASNVCWQH